MKASLMASPQSLSERERRLVSAGAADCAERVLPLFEAEAPDDDRPRDAIARARAYARGELDTAGEIRRRFIAGRAAASTASAAVVRDARRLLPVLGEDSAGPLAAGGLLARGVLGSAIRALQDRLAVEG
ncbi:putative immunity protein [Gryllotalpicola reticulitermitis]|uniref:Immunity protein n=1 Tax=Gryllotalpicola reticulitermitis TaxID=1184153 RepID=A0ABV8Q593_9MICO